MRDTGANASCGCLGRRDIPPSLLHAFLDGLAAAVAVAVAAGPPPGLVGFARTQPLAGVPFLAGTILVAFVAWLAVTAAPAALASYRGRPEPHTVLR